MMRRGSGEVTGSIPQTVLLYGDPSVGELNRNELAAYVRTTLGLPTRVRREFVAHHFRGDATDLAARLAAARVRHPDRPPETATPLYGEVQFELRHLEDPGRGTVGVLYDAHRLARVYRELLSASERSLRLAHVITTDRLFGTFGEDGRYHARVNLCGFPSLVSTSGIVEAPARPKEYYGVKARVATALGSVPFDAVKEPFRGLFIDYDDPRLTEVLKGYVLQCLFYHIAGEPFCEDRSCRLFNAHRQSEVIAAQIESGRLCRRHGRIAAAVRTIAGRPRVERAPKGSYRGPAARGGR